MLEEVHSRLLGVVIECLDNAEFIRLYDRPCTLFYPDPPYWGCEDDSGKAMFSVEDFERPVEQMAGLKGRFLMSINDVPEIREIFSRFDIEEVRTTYTIGKQTKNRGTRGELLVGSEMRSMGG